VEAVGYFEPSIALPKIGGEGFTTGEEVFMRDLVSAQKVREVEEGRATRPSARENGAFAFRKTEISKVAGLSRETPWGAKGGGLPDETQELGLPRFG